MSEMRFSKWQYQEPDHPGADFDSLAKTYDSAQQKFRDIQGEIQEILDFLNLNKSHTVLEFGTGTGEFAIRAASVCSIVYAVDLSDGMLRFAENKAKSNGLTNIDFIKGGFLTHSQTPLVDAIVTQLALHHLPDFWKQIALSRMADMLSDGGKLCIRDVIYSFQIKDYERSIDRFISISSEKVSEEFADRIISHIKNEYSTMDWIMEGMIERAGFNIDRKYYSEGFIGTYFCTKTQ
jgi:putative AdoMet-dependent methyltransferase